METKRKIWFKTKEGILGLMIGIGLVGGGVTFGVYAGKSTGDTVTAADWNKLVFKSFGLADVPSGKYCMPNLLQCEDDIKDLPIRCVRKSNIRYRGVSATNALKFSTHTLRDGDFGYKPYDSTSKTFNFYRLDSSKRGAVRYVNGSYSYQSRCLSYLTF